MMRLTPFTATLSATLLASLAIAIPSPPALPHPPNGHHHDDEVAMVRSYFYVGGQYEDDGAGEHLWANQMYVEKLTPAQEPVRETPIVLIHGKGQSGTVSFMRSMRQRP